MEIEFAWPQQVDTTWTPRAVAALVGQRPNFYGQPAEVLASRQCDGTVFVTLRVEGAVAEWLQAGSSLSLG